MYLDRTYTPRRRRSWKSLWWAGVFAAFVIYTLLQRPAWLVEQPLQPTPTPTRSAVSWLAEAELHRRSGDFPAAMAAYDRVSLLEPDRADALVAQAELMLMERRRLLARDYAQQAVNREPENVAALNAYARSLTWLRQYESAVNYALDALDLAPDNADTLAILGEIYASVGNWIRAQAYLDEALRVDPQNVLALRNQAVLFERQGDYRSAIRLLNQAIEAKPDRYDFYIERGRQHQALGEWDLAIESYKEAVGVMETAITLDTLGWGLYLSGDSLQAQRELRKAVAMDPDYGPALAHLGMAYYARRNYEEAAPTLERAMTLLEEDQIRLEYYYFLGLAHIYKVPRECDKAVPWLQKALEIHAESLPALEGMRICAGSGG